MGNANFTMTCHLETSGSNAMTPKSICKVLVSKIIQNLRKIVAERNDYSLYRYCFKFNQKPYNFFEIACIFCSLFRIVYYDASCVSIFDYHVHFDVFSIVFDKAHPCKSLPSSKDFSKASLLLSML